MIETENMIDRKLALERARKESQRADMKQHADKLIQGFEKLEDSHAKRAIWELFQNAIDLSDNCEIIIELKDDCIKFKHNGKPFTTNTLSCLIKQVSSKKSNNNEEVGQYGTGFITTHSFGKKILVTGSLKEGEYFIPLENFEIDRIANDSDILRASDILSDKLSQQQNQVFELVDKGELKSECSSFTTFSYQTLSILEKQNAIKAIENLSIILPYVMVLNKKLSKVRVFDKFGNETIYFKEEAEPIENIKLTKIHINNSIKKIFSINTPNEDLIIILPLSEFNKAIVFDKDLSKLFLYYPLIGTEDFGFNFLVHSKQFAPTEPRDGIHLKSKNEQVQEKELNNRNLISIASQMIFEFVGKYCLTVQNPLCLSYINFNSSNVHLSEYFSELKKNWALKFKDYQLVETENTRLKPSEAKFLKGELLIDTDYYDSIYSIVNLFWKNLPKKEIAKEWTNIISAWTDENISYISIIDVVKKIEETTKLDFFSNYNDLRIFYEYLIKYSHIEVYNRHKLLPNIKGEFRLLSQLNSTLNIDEILIKIADIIIPDVPKRYINPVFELNLGFEPYDRKQFSKDMNSQIVELNKQVKENCLLPQKILLALIDYCRIFPALENTGTRGQLLKLMCEYYQIDSAFFQMNKIENQEIEWLTATKCILRNFIWELKTKEPVWVESNILFVNRFISTIYSYYEFDDIVQTLPIFPNQLFVFCKQSELKIDSEIPEELKNLYDDIVRPKQLIRSTLVLSSFSEFLKFKDNKSPKFIGDSIDKVFQESKPYTEINEHPYKKDILWIIKKISDDDNWSKYFPFIEDKKATIMMSSISDPDKKNDLFSIIALEKNQIAILGELSRNKDFERIISLGKEALEEELRKQVDFQFKHTIGTHIEKLIREKIGSELNNLKIDVREEQDGQDIIVQYNNIVVNYIEVKSRWDVRNQIKMSPRQMENAFLNNEKYSLVCVDMTDFKNGDNDRYSVSDINEIIDRIKVLIDIGWRIEPILKGILSVKDFENEIHLTGDYRGAIPQTIVKTGLYFDNFVNHLIGKIQAN